MAISTSTTMVASKYMTAMKEMFRNMMLIAVVAMGLFSCQNSAINAGNKGDATKISTATLTFDDKSKRTQFSSDIQVWTENGITAANNRSSSRNTVADYCNPARFYVGSNLIVNASGNIHSIVFDCNSSSYATALKNSIDTTASVSVSSDRVTVTLDGNSTSFIISKFTAQVRMDALTVIYETRGNDTGGDVTPSTPDPTPGAGDDTTEGREVSESWLELPAMRTDNAYPNAVEYKVVYNGERNYTVYYDKSTYTPMWVAYPLESKHMGSLSRPSDWNYNPQINEQDQVNLNKTYQGDTHRRGHLIPNSSRNGSKGMQLQTFYFTNSVPQVQVRFNDGIWNSLEQAVQNIIRDEKIYVTTGVAFEKVGENKSVSYIKSNSDTKSVPIPNYFYKVVLKVKTNSSGAVTSASTIGFWMENKEHSDTYTNYSVSVDQIEAWTGFDFFVNLPDAVENAAEQNSSWDSFRSW